jgi:hypothetical protein
VVSTVKSLCDVSMIKFLQGRTVGDVVSTTDPGATFFRRLVADAVHG